MDVHVQNDNDTIHLVGMILQNKDHIHVVYPKSIINLGIL